MKAPPWIPSIINKPIILIMLISLFCLAILAIAFIFQLTKQIHWLEQVGNLSQNTSVQTELLIDQRYDVIVFTLLSAAVLIMITLYFHRKTSQFNQQVNTVLINIANNNYQGHLSLFSLHDPSQLAQATNRVTRQLNEKYLQIAGSINEVFDASVELSNASQQGAQGSAEQSQAISSIAAGMEQVSSSIKEASQYADNAQERVEMAHQQAMQGAKNVGDIINEISHINTVVEKTAIQVATLQQQTLQISSITDIIQQIAEKTNLLALNAAIEAARAGEHGRGFTVVAEEVRELAIRSSESSSKITDLIRNVNHEMNEMTANMKSVQEAVDNGVQLSSNAEASLNQIEEQSSQMVNFISQITQALSEQSDGIQFIAEKIENINTKTEENSDVVDQTDSAAQHLSQLSRNLKDILSTS